MNERKRSPEGAGVSMDVEVADLPSSRLAEYAVVPIRFRVVQRVTRQALGIADDEQLPTELVPTPYDKNYDGLAGMSPRTWPRRFDLRDWGLVVARREGVIVGGAAIAPAARTMGDVDSPSQSAVLWDLRVALENRGQGVGAALFRAAERWAIAAGYQTLIVETQDINVPACTFYRRMGCRLVSYEEDGYPDVPGEARLIWRRALASR